MDWDLLLQWAASPAVIAAIIAWLNRRRIGSWFAAQAKLAACRAERDDLLASLVRTRAEREAERAASDQTQAYLTAALGHATARLADLTAQAERAATVLRAAQPAASATSSAASTSPSPGPSPPPPSSPPSSARSRARTRSRSSRPKANGTTTKGNGHDQTPSPFLD